MREQLAKMAASQAETLSKQRALEEDLEKERGERHALEARVQELEARSRAGRQGTRRKGAWRETLSAVEEGMPPNESASGSAAIASERPELGLARNGDAGQEGDLAQFELRCVHVQPRD